MTNDTGEVVWTRNLLKFLGILVPLVDPYSDNHATLHIANNPVFHERTEHIEVDCLFLCDHIASGDIKRRYTPSTE